MNDIESILDEFELYATDRQKKYGTLLAFSITNSCPLKCDHCIVNANSSDDKLSADDYDRCLTTLKDTDHTINQISVTGGEPFFVPNKLKIFSDFCSEQNIKLGVVTSAYWAADYNKALKTINMYDGISHYSISTDQYHLKYVSMSCIKNAYIAAKHLNKKVVIRISGESADSIMQDDALKEVYDFVTNEKEVVFQRLLPFGRAKSNCHKRFQFTEIPPSLPCFSNAPVIRENGFVEPCCGAIISLQGNHPMVLGNVLNEDFSSILSKINENWLFNYIRLWGLHDFIEIIEKSEHSDKLSKMYLDGDDVCTTCCEIFSDKNISNFLENISKSLEFRLKVAIGLKEYFDNENAINIVKVKYGI